MMGGSIVPHDLPLQTFAAAGGLRAAAAAGEAAAKGAAVTPGAVTQFG